MKEITISNDSFYDKDYFSTFAKQEEYKFFSVSNDTPKTFNSSLDTLSGTLGEEMVQERFKDRPLVESQIQSIQNSFSELLANLKKEREPFNLPKNKTDVLKNIDLKSYERLIEICSECLSENKPMYLSLA